MPGNIRFTIIPATVCVLWLNLNLAMSRRLKKVMIVDDDPGVQDAFRLIFERAGYITCVFSNGNIILAGDFELPDIIILDKQLSGVDGLDVCRFLKSQERTRHVPVIIVSAAPQVAQQALAACADGFLEKPFRNKELLDLVARRLATQE
jgi:CheY-like chemotaxis protein